MSFLFFGRVAGCVVSFCSPTAESFGVSAQIGSGVVRGGPEVRFHKGSTSVNRVPPGFHKGSTRVPPGFHEGSTRVPRGSARLRGGAGWCEHQKIAPHAREIKGVPLNPPTVTLFAGRSAATKPWASSLKRIGTQQKGTLQKNDTANHPRQKRS